MAARRRISTNLSRHARIGLSLGALWVLGLAHETSVSAFNYIIDANGAYWGIQDAASPRVDTGSIRATQVAPGGRDAAYSTAINGFGGIKVLVLTTTAARLNGELMRGFGLQFDGLDRFSTTQSVDLAGVTISRSVYINRGANWGRWLDTFTNTTNAPLTIKVAFGGQSGVGIGASGGTNHTSVLVKTSSGDAGLNDGGGNKNAFGRRDTPGAANGIPTVVFPAGYNNHGQPLTSSSWDGRGTTASSSAMHTRSGRSPTPPAMAMSPRRRCRRCCTATARSSSGLNEGGSFAAALERGRGPGPGIACASHVSILDF